MTSYSRSHYVDDLLPEDVTTVDGVPVTSPTRTILDLAASRTDADVARILDTAIHDGHTTEAELHHAIARHPRHAGCARLSPLLKQRAARRPHARARKRKHVARRKSFPPNRPDLEVDGFTFSPEQLADELYIVPGIAGEVLPDDVVVVDGEEMLSPERTLLDLAPCTRAVDFWRLIDDFLARRITTIGKLRRAVARHPGHKGGPRLELFLKEWSRSA